MPEKHYVRMTFDARYIPENLSIRDGMAYYLKHITSVIRWLEEQGYDYSSPNPLDWRLVEIEFPHLGDAMATVLRFENAVLFDEEGEAVVSSGFSFSKAASMAVSSPPPIEGLVERIKLKIRRLFR